MIRYYRSSERAFAGKGSVLKPHILIAAAAFVLGSPAVAATAIPGLFSTGVDATGAALVGGNGIIDPHYLILSSTSPGFAGQQAVTYVSGSYLPNDANSRWISLNATGGPGNNITVYRTTFDLTGFDHTTALITGRWSVDDFGTIVLNGVDTAFVISTFQSFRFLTSFTLNSGFVAGLNTLDFRVQDFGAPSGLRVADLSGTADLLGGGDPGGGGGVVPEPATWAMLIAGFGLVGTVARRRRAAAVAA